MTHITSWRIKIKNIDTGRINKNYSSKRNG
jgi:hypothetical protein